MTEIRPARAADAPRLSVLLAQLGYSSELAAVTSRLLSVPHSATQQVLGAGPHDGSRTDGYTGLERRPTLHQDEHVEITDLLVDSGARRSGLSHALVAAGERWTVQHGPRSIVARSNAPLRPESHPFYEGIGYQRAAASHICDKQL